MKYALVSVVVAIALLGCRNKSDLEAHGDLILATTTSTYDSGLLDDLVPQFESKSGYTLKTIAVGSGQAMAMGRRGEVDVLLVHSPAAEREFLEGGFGINRQRVMYNDFVIVGPQADPAAIGGADSASAALAKIASAGALFVSRSDDSGTHAREMGFWKQARLVPAGNEWYIETGTGMGKTLTVASEKKGYTLTDRGTYLALAKNLDLEILVQGDPELKNIYHVIEANPEKFPKVNNAGASAFAEFLLSSEIQDRIGKFGTKKFRMPLFYPDAIDISTRAP